MLDYLQKSRKKRRLVDISTDSHIKELILVQITVKDNNVDQALRMLKKKMQREGIFREMKQRRFFEKPSEKRVREKQEAVRRARKLARKNSEGA